MVTKHSNTQAKLDPRLHFVVATAIIVKDGKYLIAKRAAWEKVFPNLWTVPGGKLKYGEYKLFRTPKTGHLQKYNVVDETIRNEVKQEVGLQINKPQYVCDLVFMRQDGYPVVTLSYWANHKSGKVKLSDELTEHAWVTLTEAKKYDLIDGIWDELKMVDNILKKNN